MFRSGPGSEPGCRPVTARPTVACGHMILLRVQLRLERDAEQVFLNSQANLKPAAFSMLSGASAHEGYPAVPTQPRWGRAR